ncbi:hypothetical protein K505DRAFT_23148 [Melanomma pulvis-pyrius CBS 109.77]|uniref:Uncharacterized protein n=1 Tax=Melanomma pulvis-pyrius CBS 109.77 TaxID=1314802 RepID=A0A6A6XEL2_9PLEO|nr:hypothetical protein K505DRAFT_23148 [Melanomma pulvis-pyrius CBS 109.77]
MHESLTLEAASSFLLPCLVAFSTWNGKWQWYTYSLESLASITCLHNLGKEVGERQESEQNTACGGRGGSYGGSLLGQEVVK